MGTHTWMGCGMANGIVIVIASYNLYKPEIILVPLQLFSYHFQIYFYASHGGLPLVLLVGIIRCYWRSNMLILHAHGSIHACDTAIKVVPRGNYQIDKALITKQSEGNKFTWGLSLFDMWKCWWRDFTQTLTSRIGGIFGSFTFSFKSILLITVSQRVLGSSPLHHYSSSRGLHR